MHAIVFSPPSEKRHWLLAASGVVEVALVLAASLAAGIAASQAVSPGLAAALGLIDNAAPDMLGASAALAAQLAAQYGVMFVLVALLAIVRGRRHLASYALAPPAPGGPNAIGYGLVLGFVISIVPAAIMVLQDWAPIGQDAPIWAAMRRAEWDWSFWLFMAVGGFGLIPLLEEGAWRGYILGRLGEGFAPGAAVLVTTLLFALLHVQYLRADAAMALSFAALLAASLAFAFATLRSGSLAPAIIAHAVLNFPLSTEGNIAKAALGVAAIGFFWRQIRAELGFWRACLWRRDTWAALPALGALAVFAAGVMLAPLYAGAALLVVFIAIGFLKRSAWA